MKTVWNKPATLRDVAKLAGVSRWVAGKVLNGGSGNTRARDETSNRIRRIAKELDYHPNPGSRLLRGNPLAHVWVAGVLGWLSVAFVSSATLGRRGGQNWMPNPYRQHV